MLAPSLARPKIGTFRTLVRRRTLALQHRSWELGTRLLALVTSSSVFRWPGKCGISNWFGLIRRNISPLFPSRWRWKSSIPLSPCSAGSPRLHPSAAVVSRSRWASGKWWSSVTRSSVCPGWTAAGSLLGSYRVWSEFFLFDSKFFLGRSLCHRIPFGPESSYSAEMRQGEF